jgi:hypothetical protein
MWRAYRSSSSADSIIGLHRHSDPLDHDQSDQDPALCLSMILPENRFPLFGIML